jgi:8-oxo-dGTP pyrophosphatase MutT (NUDIX family)
MVITCGIYLYSTKQKKMLICHATNSPWNKWSIPKGLKDNGEDEFHAAIRELREETGIIFENLHVIETHLFPPVKYKKQNKILISYLVITDSDFENFPFTCHSYTRNALQEVDKWKWESLESAASMIHESQQENIPQIKELIAAFDASENRMQANK